MALWNSHSNLIFITFGVSKLHARFIINYNSTTTNVVSIIKLRFIIITIPFKRAMHGIEFPSHLRVFTFN